MITIDGTFVQIDWTDTNINFATITAYKIFIITSSGTYVENTNICDGSRSTIVTAQRCRFLMSALWVSPHTLTRGSDIRAKVQSINIRGSSPLSSASDLGQLVMTVPDQISSPIRNSATSISQIVITWSPLVSPANGGSAITSYYLEWDDGSTGT